MLETCQLVIDRPAADDDEGALMYVAEPLSNGRTSPVATSPAFHPEHDLTEHRSALAEIEASLRAAGWQRAKEQARTLIGERFERWRDD